jgi:tRNA A37 threonylcarbamoyladenosine dehydratase
LLQAWYAGRLKTGSPYRLFALSNLASLAARPVAVVGLGGVGPRISNAAEHWPLLRSCGVIQMIVARKLSRPVGNSPDGIRR